MTFATAVPVLFTSFVYCTNMYWSVIHGIKRKPHLSVAWNWYHFVAIAILHQPRPTDSADINARLQLSDTSSIPPMHGGFLLISPSLIVWCTFIYICYTNLFVMPDAMFFCWKYNSKRLNYENYDLSVGSLTYQNSILLLCHRYTCVPG